jgi:hypothetical protein
VSSIDWSCCGVARRRRDSRTSPLRIADAGREPAVRGRWAGTVRGALGVRPGRAPRRVAASFDPSSLRFPLELRAWRPGDRIRLRIRQQEAEEAVSGAARRAQGGARSLPVLTDADGAMLWVVGVARSSDAPPPARRRFQITVMDGDTE